MTKNKSRSYAARRDKAREVYHRRTGQRQAPSTENLKSSLRSFRMTRKAKAPSGAMPLPTGKRPDTNHPIPVNNGNRNNQRFNRKRGKKSLVGSSHGKLAAASPRSKGRLTKNTSRKNKKKILRVKGAMVEVAPTDYGNERTTTVVYTDGACSFNGKHNAVAGIGVWWGPEDKRNLSERCPGLQTNNRAELFAVVRLLEESPIAGHRGRLVIRTDSMYTINCAINSASKWEAQGWMTAAGGKVRNAAMIKYLLALLSLRATQREVIIFEHVRGHSNNVGNDAADALARRGTTYPIIPERNWFAGQKRVEAAIQASIRLTMSVSRSNIQNQVRFVIEETD